MSAKLALADPDDLRACLVAAAKGGHALTYADLLGMLGYEFSRPKMRQLCAILADVDANAAGRGEPELAVLVVRQSDGLPGQGWWLGTSARARGYRGPWEGPEAARFIAAVQAETFGWWRSRNGAGDTKTSD